MIQYKEISVADGVQLREFLKQLGSSERTFRYYQNRPISCIKNHQVTLLGFIEDNVPISYGHLDLENQTTWLAICVLPQYLGMGYGKDMMKELIKRAKHFSIQKIRLSVDRNNIVARKLYESCDFKVIVEDEIRLFYELNIR